MEIALLMVLPVYFKLAFFAYAVMIVLFGAVVVEITIRFFLSTTRTSFL